mmetsp:Transcript_18401/g.38513  ORF Transcript_18401/g.38513 Transcript_18401/m.38513 type:complete len:401 (-) Transcript_18401:2503-3705(-)
MAQRRVGNTGAVAFAVGSWAGDPVRFLKRTWCVPVRSAPGKSHDRWSAIRPKSSIGQHSHEEQGDAFLARRWENGRTGTNRSENNHRGVNHGRDHWRKHSGKGPSTNAEPVRDSKNGQARNSRGDGTSFQRELSDLQRRRASGHDFLFGVAPVLAALLAGRREIFALHWQESMDLTKRKDRNAVIRARDMAERKGLDVVLATKGDLNILTENRPHQGLVLECSPLDFEPLPRMPDPGWKPACWLVLDEIEDPMNFGALCRTAHYLGLTGVVTCHRNSAPLSPVVSKASAGAVEAMTIHSTHSMPRFLREARELGWVVVGGALAPDAVECRNLSLDKPTMLVLGNEGRGIRPLVSQACSLLVRIPSHRTQGDTETVDSLNVSVAGGILMHQLISSASYNQS